MTEPVVQNRLPLWRTVRETYALTCRHSGDFLRIAWAWLVVLTALVALTSAFFWPSHAAALDAGMPTSWVQVLTTFLSMTAGASIAVAWHSLLLQGRSPHATRYLRLDGVVWRYLLVGLALLVPFYVSAFLIPGWGTETDAGSGSQPESAIASALVFLLALLLAVKLSPILPALAIGRSDITLGAVWRATGGNWWRLFIGGLLTAIPPPLLLSLPAILKAVSSIDQEPVAETQLGFVLSNTQSELATVVGGIFAVSFLSLVLRHFFPDVASAPTPAQASTEPTSNEKGAQR